MSVLRSLIGQPIELMISGRPLPETGLLIDVGDDILVYYGRGRYCYIPIKHLHYLQAVSADSFDATETQPDDPIERIAGDSISYRKTLLNARGLFVELHIAGSHSLHGYTTSIMNDYLVFYSSVFHTVYVSLDHLKAIVPYPVDALPYSTEKEFFTVKPSNLTLARTFEQQIKKLEGRMVVLDTGDAANKIGLLQAVDQGFLTLVSAGGESLKWNVHHIKSVHTP